MITNKWIPNTTRPPTSVLGYLIAGLALLAMSLPGAVHADDECGAIGSSREVTCGPGNYENGIRYLPGNEGLTLILDQGDGTITVGNPGVHIGSGSDISVIGKDIGTIITEGDYNHALSIVGDTVSNSTLTIEQGNITAKGLHGFGIHFGIRTSGTYAVVVNGGTITGGSVVGAAINVAANDGGTIFVGPGAVIDGSASRIAIRDGIYIYDSLSTIYVNSDVTVTTAGRVTGDSNLLFGNDTFNLTGGVYQGVVWGSYGNDVFNWTGGRLTGTSGLNEDIRAGFFGGRR